MNKLYILVLIVTSANVTIYSSAATFSQSFSSPYTANNNKPHYLPHPWIRPTYDAKQHSDPIRRYSTMHWTDRRTHEQTDRPTDHLRESLMTIADSPLRL